MTEINTSRLKILPITLEEAQAVASLVTEKVSYWTSPIPWPYTIKDAEWWLNNTSPEKRLGIYLDSILIGTISIPTENGDEVGFWINEQFEGKGYATEAAKAVIEYAFSNQKLQFLDSSVHRDNVGSRKIHEKLGFKIIEETERFWPNKKATVPVILYRLRKNKAT